MANAFDMTGSNSRFFRRQTSAKLESRSQLPVASDQRSAATEFGANYDTFSPIWLPQNAKALSKVTIS